MMASRRTRIKGIANIPQRRKTTTTASGTEEDPKPTLDLEQVKEDEPNLNSKHGVPSADNVVEDTSKSVVEEPENHQNEKNENIEPTPVPIPEGFVPSTEPDSEPPHVPAAATNSQDDGVSNGSVPKVVIIAPPKEETETVLGTTDKTHSSVHNPTQQQPTVPARRKFIKPTVSSNAFNRKPKDAVEVNTVPVNNNNGRNNKIVILNEIISYPDQNQHIVVQSHHPSQEVNILPQEAQDNWLKPEAKPPVNSLERDIKRLVPNSPQVTTTELEYPIPPPSPNKINRSRIKAVPRLGQRHTSFSASESEDESRRNYRHRNDSVCSSASGIQDTNSIPECPSPQKPKEFNSVIQRKCRRTEQSRKLAEARRDFYLKFGNEKPDRQKLTMIDLIFYNPVTNPMSGDNKNKRKNSMMESDNNDEVGKEEAVDDPNKTESDEENEVPAPQIKIGPSGEIVVDEQSLVIENKAVKKSREKIEKSEVVNGDSETGYGMYKRAKRSKDWSKQETLKFYKALNTIGTDFTLMCELFPRRSRRELKMKFKKEERVNKVLVDKAIMQPCGFDFTDFKHEVDMEEKELQEIEKQKEREKEMRKEAKKRKTTADKKEPPEKVIKLEKTKAPRKKRPLDIMKVLEDESDADESEIESVEGEETEEKFLQTLQKPTRSGRVPKILGKYRPSEPELKGDKHKPGSLIVMATTGSNGQPVYKVCMVTGEYGRQQIGDDMTSLEKALECKETGAGLTSLFTLTASTTDNVLENNQTLPEIEHNVTISEDEKNITIPAEENVTVPAGESNNTVLAGDENSSKVLPQTT